MSISYREPNFEGLTVKKLSRKEFYDIYTRVPRLCVDCLIYDKYDDGKVFLTKRCIQPNIGYWHIPGGTVLMGESVPQAVQRIALEETGFIVSIGELIGYIEYRDYDIGRQSISMVFICRKEGGDFRGSEQGNIGEWFYVGDAEIPDPMYPEQVKLLLEINR